MTKAELRIVTELQTPRSSVRADWLLLSLLIGLLALYVGLEWFNGHHRDQSAKPGKPDPTVEWWVEAPKR